MIMGLSIGAVKVGRPAPDFVYQRPGGGSARIHALGTLEGATRPARPLPPAILAIRRSPEVEDLNSPAEVQKGVLGSKLRRRDLAPPKAALILFARSLLLGR